MANGNLMNKLVFTVTDQIGETVAAFKTPEDAAMYVGCVGDGYAIRHAGLIVWNEGKETQPALESYDNVAAVVYSRI
jgi:hypothetical protein